MLLQNAPVNTAQTALRHIPSAVLTEQALVMSGHITENYLSRPTSGLAVSNREESLTLFKKHCIFPLSGKQTA